MKIKLWGVRGSVACPGPDTVKYGGNTTCISVDFDGEREIIIDAGTGLRVFGNYLVKKTPKGKNIEIDLLLSHTHWDHIKGFPFFTPIYLPTTKLKVYGPVPRKGDNLDEILNRIFSYKYFPINRSQLGAEIKSFPLKEKDIELYEGIRVKTKFLNHPIACLGYRIEHKEKSFCFITDSEPYIIDSPKESAEEKNQKVAEFFRDADLLIHDAQYTVEEWKKSKIGWGHSGIEYVIETAAKVGVKKLILTHHDPERTDDDLDKFTDLYQEKYKKIREKMPFSFAQEGSVIEI